MSKSSEFGFLTLRSYLIENKFMTVESCGKSVSGWKRIGGEPVTRIVKIQPIRRIAPQTHDNIMYNLCTARRLTGTRERSIEEISQWRWATVQRQAHSSAPKTIQYIWLYNTFVRPVQKSCRQGNRWICYDFFFFFSLLFCRHNWSDLCSDGNKILYPF